MFCKWEGLHNLQNLDPVFHFPPNANATALLFSANIIQSSKEHEWQAVVSPHIFPLLQSIPFSHPE